MASSSGGRRQSRSSLYHRRRLVSRSPRSAAFQRLIVGAAVLEAGVLADFQQEAAGGGVAQFDHAPQPLAALGATAPFGTDARQAEVRGHVRRVEAEGMGEAGLGGGE